MSRAKAEINTSPLLDLEDSVSEVEALLKLLGEAYQQVVETDHNESLAAMGLLNLRRSTLARLYAAVDAVRDEVHTSRKGGAK